MAVDDLILSRLVRTLSDTFDIGVNRWRASVGILSARNNADTAYVNVDALAFRILVTFGDANPLYALGLLGLVAGPGGAVVVDTFLARIAPLSWGVNNPSVGAFDGGSLIIAGITRVGTGLQSFGPGVGFFPTVGAARGIGAVDLQFSRDDATQIASGLRSALVGGENNTASGTNSGVFGGRENSTEGTSSVIVGGEENEIDTTPFSAIIGGLNNFCDSGRSAIIGGESNSITGIGVQGRAAILGGTGNSVTAQDGLAHGDTCSVSGEQGHATGVRARATHKGEFAQSSGQQTGAVRAQNSLITWCATTTDLVSEILYLDGAAIEYDIPLSSSVAFEITIAARNADQTIFETAIFNLVCAVERSAGVPVFVGGAVSVAATVVVSDGVLPWTVVATISGSNLRLTATGELGKSVKFGAMAVPAWLELLS